MPLEILRNVGGVLGLHVALDAFTEEAERELFESAMHLGSEPRDAQRHGSHTNPEEWSYEAPEILRVCNVVKDSGLVPGYVPPDYLFAISYPAGCTGFKEHFDSRYRWGETVVGVTLGRECVMYFVPGNGAIKARGVPAAPESSTSLPVTVKRYPSSGSFAIELSLPRRSIYVMSGAARVDFKHGIRALPRVDPRAPPAVAWNPHSMRRALTLRATKAYSDHCLDVLLKASPKDASVRARVDAQSKWRPEGGHYAQDSGGRLNDEALTELRALARAHYEAYQRLPLGVRFPSSQLTFPLPAAAVAENAAAQRLLHGGGGRGGGAVVASGGWWTAVGDGHRLGGGGHAATDGGFGGAHGGGSASGGAAYDDAAAAEEAELAAAIAASLEESHAPSPLRARADKRGGAHGAGPSTASSRASEEAAIVARASAAITARRECWWPYPKGTGHLGVSWKGGVDANLEALRSRIDGSPREFTASQALHRMSDGMANLSGPPNGEARPTLATKWKATLRGVDPSTIDEHVHHLKMWLARRALAELQEMGRATGAVVASAPVMSPARATGTHAAPIALDESDEDNVEVDEDDAFVVEPPTPGESRGAATNTATHPALAASSASSSSAGGQKRRVDEESEAEQMRLVRLRRFEK